jgi:capsular polysaccharide export protein
MSFKYLPESKSRAQKAYKQSVRPAKNPMLAWVQKKIYEWQYNGSRQFFITNNDTVAVAWNGLNGSRQAFMSAATDAGVKCLYFEEAPLPQRITIDPNGVNFVNSLPREITPYVKWLKTSNIAHDNWRKTGRIIKQRLPITPPSDSVKLAPPLGEPFLFVALQVPNDSQLRLFGGSFKTVDDFICAILKAAKDLPQGWHIRIKAHPSSKHSVERYFAKNNTFISVSSGGKLVGSKNITFSGGSSVSQEEAFKESLHNLASIIKNDGIESVLGLK